MVRVQTNTLSIYFPAQILLILEVRGREKFFNKIDIGNWMMRRH